MRLKLISLSMTIALSITAPAYAGSEINSLINMLHENGMVSDEQYGRLMAELKQNQTQTVEEKANVDKKLTEATTSSDIDVSVKNGIKIKTRDDKFSAKLGGRLQADAAIYSGDPEMGNGTEIRRAWLHFKGTMYQDWDYMFQYEFSSANTNGSAIKSAFVAYNGFDDLKLTVGKFREPFSLQDQTPDIYATFTELGLPDAFAAGRHVGVMASTAQQHWSLASGIFGNSSASKASGEDEGWGATTRATWAPINDSNNVLHLGLGVSYSDTGDAGIKSFKQQAETHISGVNIVNTGTINNVTDYLKVGAEIAAVKGPFSAQAEYITTSVNRSNNSDLDFNGWYAQSSYFLTGESRNYNKGKFGRVTPKHNVGEGGIGAWELALRYSTIDLTDGDINGGEADSVTLGLNWYPTPTLRFMANYVDVLDIKGGSYDRQEPRVFQVRSQWAF